MELRVGLSRLVLSVAITVSSASAAMAFAAEPLAADDMAAVMELWRTGDLQAAQEQLTQMIEAGTRDARVYYYRALVSEQLGSDSEQDLKTAASLEAETTSTRLVNRALEGVQGAGRAKIEKYRAAARAKYKPDPGAEAVKALFREGLEVYNAGDPETALARFDAAIEKGGVDARVYYFRGVMLAEMGETEKAKLAFAQGLSHEKSLEDIRLVNSALAAVQGSIRQMIEEQTTVEIDGEVASRQAVHRMIRRLASLTQEEHLAGASAAAGREAEQEQAEAAARQRKAAEAILAQNKAQQDAEKLLKTADTPTADLLAAADAPKKTEVAASRSEAEATLSAEKPDAPVATNPFLGGKPGIPGAASSRADGGPIDVSYLPADADFIFYGRPADILASAFVKPLRSSPKYEEAMTQMAAQVGFDVNDIESVTSGVSNFVGGMTQLGLLAASGQDPTAMAQNVFGGGNAVSILRTKKDVELATITAASKGQESTFDGKSYYLIDSPQPNQPKVAIYSVDPRTWVFGVEKAIQRVISDGPGEPTSEQFSFVSNGSPFVMAFSGPLMAGMSGSIPEAPADAPPFVNQMAQAVRGKIAGAAIIMDFGSNLDLKVVVNLTETEAAEEVQVPLDQGLGMAKQMYPQVAQLVPPALQGPVNQLVNSLGASHSGSVATIAVRIPGQIVSVLQDNPAMFQGMIPMGPGGPAGPPR